jgi:hypothetical protein
LRYIPPFLKIFAAIVFAAILAVSVLLARLWMGPISVPFLTPYLKTSLLFDRQDLNLDFDEAVLALEGVDNDENTIPTVKIRLNHVRLYDAKGAELLSIPSGAVGLSIAGLLRGMVAPSTIEIDGPTLHVDWRGGDIFADFGNDSDTDNMLEDIPNAVEKASLEILPFFIRELASPVNYKTSAGYLRKIRILNANLVLHERVTNTLWTLPGARLELARSENGVKLDAKGLLKKTGMKNTSLAVTGNYDTARQETALKIEFRGLNPAAFAGSSESMTVFRAVDMPLDGVLSMNLGQGRRIVSAGFDIDSGAGTLNLPKLYQGPVHFDQIKAKGSYDRRLKQFAIERLYLAFGRASFEGDGQFYAGQPGPGIRVNGDIKNLPLLALKEYWPKKLATGGYEWVTENITAGVATSGNLQFNMTPAMRKLPKLPEAALNFNFSFEGVEAHYLRPMPPIKEGKGFATLTPSAFDLTVENAQVAGVKMLKSHLHFKDLDDPEKTLATVEADFTGTLPKALTLIDHEPLGYPSQYGLKPDTVMGKTDIHLKLAFPLKRSIRLKDVDFDVLANLKSLSIPHLFETTGLDQGALKMHVDRKGIDTVGKIALNGVPFDFTWKEDFADDIKYSSRYSLKTPLSDGQWAALHVPVGDYVKGPSLLSVKLQGKGARIMEGKGTLDFTGAEISTGRLDWVKPAGEKAIMTFAIERDGEGLDIKDINYRDSRLKASGSLALGPENEILEADLSRFDYGDTSLSANLKPDAAGGYDVALKASRFDGRPLIKKLTETKQDDKEMELPDFRVNAQIDQLTTESGITLHHIKALASYENNLWANIGIKGKFTNAGNFSFDISPQIPGPQNQASAKINRKLAVSADDAGELGRAFGLFRNAVGGALSVNANLSGTGQKQVLKGKVEAKNFKIVKSPVLGDILAKGPKGAGAEALKAESISFDEVEMPFIFQNGAIEVKPSRAYGPSMGVTIEGGIDLRYDSLILNGTIVPAYTLNSILRWMPVVGDLLMGGKGKGLFALTYKITGPVAAPKVDVNPLAVLAPGFLRGIVEAFEGAGATVTPERKAAEKKAAQEKLAQEKAAGKKARQVIDAQKANP